MFTDDVSKETIDGISYYTFQPNTIVYAVPVDSNFGKIINNAKIGVVWHTTYTGKELQDMKIIWCKYLWTKKTIYCLDG